MSEYGISTCGLDGATNPSNGKGKGMKNCRKRKREAKRKEEMQRKLKKKQEMEERYPEHSDFEECSYSS